MVSKFDSKFGKGVSITARPVDDARPVDVASPVKSIVGGGVRMVALSELRKSGTSNAC